MISGINTDIKVGDVVYHVQTEDKGAKSRLLLSLVYDKGTILASKRVSYDDVLNGEFDERQLVDQLNRQHQVICAAVSAGRIDDLKAMTRKTRAKKAAPVALSTASVASTSVLSPAELLDTTPTIPKPSIPVTPPNGHEVVIDGIEIVDDGPVLEPEAVEVVSELSGRERAANDKVTLELLGDTKFKAGDHKTIIVMVCRGTERKVIPGAEIMVKLLGSSFRPVIFHSRSDSNGLAKIDLQLPHFSAGRAAMLVRAIAAGEEIEVRRIVSPG